MSSSGTSPREESTGGSPPGNAENTRARIENNIAAPVVPGILGDDCMPTGGSYVGLEIVSGDGVNEPVPMSLVSHDFLTPAKYS